MTFEYKPLVYPSNAIHISLDLETASLEPSAAILQIGAVSVHGSQSFNSHISFASNEVFGRHVSIATMKWWDKQDLELRKRVFGGTNSLEDSLEDFISWCQSISSDDLSRIFLWSKPQCFDIQILKCAVEHFGEWPFGYRNVGDVYTAIRSLPEYKQEAIHQHWVAHNPTAQAHDAAADASYQAEFIKGFLAWHIS